MPVFPFQCPRCRQPAAVNAVWQDCGKCQSVFHVEVFPALFRVSAPSQAGEALMLDGESSCFYHPNKKAVLPCQGCGRFLCALCDCELHGQHFCPACLEVGKAKGKITSLENHRILYDTIAFALAFLPIATILFWFMSLITAPAALFVSIRYWNAPRSIVHRTKIRYVLAILIAIVELGGWGLIAYAVIRGSNV